MKHIISLVFIFSISTLLYADDIQFEKDGALLWTENCMGCHIPQTFLAAVPDEGYVEELIQDIEFNIYSPGSGMSELYFLNNDEIEKIATFLI